MAEFNYLNLPGLHSAGQRAHANDFAMERAKVGAEREDKAYDDNQKLANTRFLAGSTKVLLDLYQKDPDEFYVALDELGTEGMRRGILDPDRFDPKTVTIDQIQEMHHSALVGLAGKPIVDPTAGANVGKTWVNPDTQTMWGMTRDGRSFDTGIPAQQYALRPVETGEGTVMVDTARQPSGMAPQAPGIIQGTDPESMRRRAVQDELQKGEAGRGRVLTDEGFEAVPGSKAEIEEQERANKIITRSRMKSIQAQTVVEDVTRLSQMLAEGRVPLGRKADAQELLPRVAQDRDYVTAKSLIKSVQGNIGVDQLLNIKAQGAGLGQVPQTQLDMLSRLLGELDMGQLDSDFMWTWTRAGRIYDQIWQLADKDMRELGMPPPNIFSFTQGMTMVESPDMVWQMVEQGMLKPGDKFLTPDGQIKRVPGAQ